MATAEDVDRAVACAEAAQPAWAATSACLRARILRRFADLIHKHTATLQNVGQTNVVIII
jgi:acyl-CoA reductase-like NAD-dependent aldehyde dehydrogenase